MKWQTEKRIVRAAENLLRRAQATGRAMLCTRALPLCLLLAVSSGCDRRSYAPPAQTGHATAGPSASALSPIEARARLAATVAMNPDEPHPALTLARFDRDNGRAPDAERELAAICRRFPRYVDAAFDLGSLYLNRGENDAALSYLKTAAKLAPNSHDTQVMAGLASFRLGRTADARRFVDEAIRLDKDAADSYLLLARIYSTSGTAQKAMAALRDYLKRSREPEPGYYLMGRLYYRQADMPEAERWLKRAIDARRDNPDTWAMLGHVYAELDNGRRIDEGIECYAKALALRPNAGETEAALGRALMQQHRWEESIGHLRAAVRSAPDAGPLLYTLGQALLRAGHTDEGRRILAEYQAYRDFSAGIAERKRAVEQSPHDRSRRYALTRYCLSYGQFAAADQVLTETEHKLGSDDMLRRLRAQVAAAREAKSANAP